MTDIAALGISVDSSQVTKAGSALTALAAAAAAAEKSSITTATAMTGLGNAAKTAGQNTSAIAASTGLARFELINLSRQIQDVGVSLAGGQSPLMVLAQQGSQIADIFSSSKTATVGGAIKQVASGITGFITPLRAVAIGTTALGIAAYALNSNWKTFTLTLDDTAKAAGTTTASMSKLQAAAAFKGIAGDDFTKGIAGFARGVYDAQQNMGSLAEVFRANNRQAATFDDYLANSADLIKNAGSDQQRLVLLQQMGLPPTMEWVRLLSGGADGLRKAKEQAAEFAANDNMVASARRFDETWNRAWTNFGLNSRSAFQTAIEAAGSMGSTLERLAQKAGNSSIWNRLLPSNHADVAKGLGIESLTNFASRFSGTESNPAAGNGALADGLRAKADRLNNPQTVDPSAITRALSLEQQHISLLGQTATAADAVRSVEIAVAQARLNGVSITKDQVDTLKRLAAEQTLGISAIKASADAQRVEGDTVGMSIGSATAYAAAQNAINDARRNGRALTDINIAAIQSEATALGAAAERADTMRTAYEGLVRGPLQTLQSSIASGSTFFDALKKSGASALNSISSKLADMAAQNLWKSAFGGSSGGGLMSLLGLGGGELPGFGTPSFIGPTLNHSGYGPGDRPGPTRLVHSSYFDNAPRFHSGIGPGERAAIIRNDESVLTPGQMKQLSPSSGAQSVHVTVGVDVDKSGNLQAYVKDVAQDTSQKTVTGFAGSDDFKRRAHGAALQGNRQRWGS